MAETKVSSSELAPRKYTDANGWVVYDFGNRKMYTRKYNWTGSNSLTSGSNISLPAIALPTGIATRADIVLNYVSRGSDRTFIVNERVAESATNILLEVNNWYSSTITVTKVDVDFIAWNV